MVSTTAVTGEQQLGLGAAAVVMLSEIIKLKPKLSGRTGVGTVPMLLTTVIGCWRSFDWTKWPSDVSRLSSMQIIARLEAPSLLIVIVYIMLFVEFTRTPSICSTKYGKINEI